MADFDLAVIGAGAAGLSVTAVAAQLGVKVALIEQARMGGDCLNTGCVPSKALLAAAHAARAIRGAGRFGLHVAEPHIDWNAVRAHVHGAIAAIAPMDSEARFRALGATVLRGTARFVGRDALAMDGRRITARRIVIAAGSRAAVPPIPGLDRAPFLTNESLFDLTARPEHLLILGGGPIGLEMADAFAGLGTRVTVVEAARIAGREDPELTAGLRSELATLGVALEEGAEVASVETGVADRPVLVLRMDGGSRAVICSSRSGAGRTWRVWICRPGTSAHRPPASSPTAACGRSATGGSSRWATSPIPSASARARSLMSAATTPESSSAARYSACRRGWTTPHCPGSPTPTPNWRRPA